MSRRLPYLKKMVSNQFSIWRSVTSQCWQLAGNDEKADYWIHEIKNNETKYNKLMYPYALACQAAIKNEKEKAMEYVKEAYGKGMVFHGGTHHHDPAMKNLRGYPPFKEFIKPK